MAAEVKENVKQDNVGVKRGTEEIAETKGRVQKRKRYESRPERSIRNDERREIMTKAKSIWEELRPKATGKEKREKLVGELLEMLRGRVVEFVFRHDGSRIVQWMLTEGNAPQVKEILEELEKANETTETPGELPFFVRLSNDRYGKHLAMKLLRKSSNDKTRRNVIYEKYLRGNVSRLMKNSCGADTLDVAFQTIVNAYQKNQLVIELLFSKEPILLKTIISKQAKSEKKKSLNFEQCCDLLGAEFKNKILESATSTLHSFIDKENLVRMNIVHCALKEYLSLIMAHWEPAKTWEIAGMIAPSLVHLTHTRAGAQVAITCVKILDAKHRKKVVRSFKGHVRKIAEDEFGHLVLIACMEWIDDTKLVGNILFTELLSKSKVAVELAGVDDEGDGKKVKQKNKAAAVGAPGQIDMDYLLELSKHKYARMILLHLLAHRQTRYFNPDRFRNVWEEVDVEKFGKLSKKAMDVRKEELAVKVRDALKHLVDGHVDELLCDTFSAPIPIGMVKDKELCDATAKATGTMLTNNERRSKVMDNMCGRKTLGTLFKIGGSKFADSVVAQCGADIVVALAAHERGIECAMHFLTATEKSEAAKAVIQAEKKIRESAKGDERKEKLASQILERARNLTSFDSVVGAL